MNLELLNRVVKQIEFQPESWEQNVWIRREDCGTTGCVAGWAALLSGWEPVFSSDGNASFVHKDDYENHVCVAAEVELGLTDPQSDWLFKHNRTFDEIKSFVHEANKEES